MKEPAIKGKDKNKRSTITAPQTPAPPGTIEVKPRSTSAFDDLHAHINHLAYELYLQRGCRDGHAEEDWLDAEREILNRECRL
jgi:Protein of unknown function (DUF2934)